MQSCHISHCPRTPMRDPTARLPLGTGCDLQQSPIFLGLHSGSPGTTLHDSRESRASQA